MATNFLDIRHIKIPIVQRDYAQGRDDEKAREVIENFLDDIFFALENKINFHLDFVYGNYEGKYFVPIDGQQRLTLLYLLHWYFAKKENIDFKNSLIYETRVLAREFTKKLNSFDIDLNKDELSLQIENHKDFIPYWKNDPSVKSMLKVLDLIHKKAKDKNISFKDLSLLTFEIFELSDFSQKQAEELYSKMNSRGKPLSEFENFKAKIEQIVLEKRDENLYKTIASKFEKEWINEFWSGSCEDAKNVDERFIKFIYFLTEMRYYDIKLEKELNIKSFSFLKEFYSNEDNLNFLISSLDKLKEFKSFSKEFESFKLFDKKEHINFFEEITENYFKISITNKILAYMLLKTLNKKSEYLLRVVRNDLNRGRTLKTGRIEYNLTIENKDIPKYLSEYNKLLNDNPYKALLENRFSTESMKQEQKKAEFVLKGFEKEIFELEDFEYLKGDLGLILSSIKDLSQIKFIHTHFIDLFKKDDSFIARAFLSFGDYNLKIGSIFRGNKYFFGQKGNWEIIFTTNTQTKEHLEVYNRFFNSLNKLESNIENKLKAYDGKNKDWIYYFLKYPLILSKYKNLSNVIGWIREWEGDISSIEKLQKHTQISNQRLNVFLVPIAKMFDDDLLRYQKIDENNLTFLEINDMQIYVEDSKICVDEEAFELFAIKDAVKEVIEYLKK